MPFQQQQGQSVLMHKDISYSIVCNNLLTSMDAGDKLILHCYVHHPVLLLLVAAVVVVVVDVAIFLVVAVVIEHSSSFL